MVCVDGALEVGAEVIDRVTVRSAIDRVLADEVDLSDPATWATDVGDGKGITRFGQTPAWLEDHGFAPPETPEHAAMNYAIWMSRYRLDELATVDPVIGYLVTDDAVHASVGDAVRRLQRCLGVHDDGLIGPKTLAAVAAADLARLARHVIAAKWEHRCELLGSMRFDRRKWAKGWGLRMGRQLRAL